MKNILVIIILLTQMVSTVIICYTVQHHIERHSVNPLYKLTENTSMTMRCQPWDSC